MKKIDMERDRLDFGKDKIGPLFRAIFFPTLIGMITMSLATVIDGIFVGRGVGADGMAAVNIVAPIWMVVTGLGLMLGIGSSVVASLQLAEKNVKAARIILTQAFGVGFVVIGMLALAGLAFARPIVYALGCSPRLESHAMDYLLWLLPGMVLLLWQCVGMMLIRLDGSPRYAMWVQVASSVTNIVLDWVFVFPLGMGVKGASIATSIACGVGGLLALAYFVWFSTTLRFYRLKMSVTSLALTLRNTWYMVKMGSATFLTEIAMSVTMLTGNYMFMSHLHEEGVAAFAVACYLFPVIFSVNNAVAQAAQPIISFNYGAKQEERVGRALHVSLFTAILCGLTITAALWLGARPTVGMFLSEQEPAFAIAIAGLPLFATCAIFFAVNIAFIGYYQSIAKAATSTFYTLLRGIIFLIPCFILLPGIIGDAGLWLAIPAAEAFTCVAIIAGYTLHKARKKRGAADQ